MPTIIVSYRREDTAWIAGRIHDRLKDHYGAENVFMDIDSIPFGLDFREHIHESLERSDILLAIVGPRWIAADESGQSRIHDENDWVRIEIEAALAKKIPVIPVLIDGTRLPQPSSLPDGVRNIVFRQAADVDAGRDFHPHMDRLIGVMDQLLARKKWPTPGPTKRSEEKAPRKEDSVKSKEAPRKEPPVQAETKTLKAASVSATTDVAVGKSSWREIVWPLLTSTQGRLSRGPFSIALVASFVVMLALVLVVGLPYNELTGHDGTPPIVLIFPLAWAWIAVALGAKRLHDLDWPAWPVALPLVLGLFVPTFIGLIGLAGDLWPRTVLGTAFILVVLLASPLGWMRGTVGPNRFGPDRLGKAKIEAN